CPLPDYRATPQTHTLSLHDALPISRPKSHLTGQLALSMVWFPCKVSIVAEKTKPGSEKKRLMIDQQIEIPTKDGHTTTFITHPEDRKSTRLNSSHRTISYAVFCLKK